MAQEQPTVLKYEASRYKVLMDEYAKLSLRDEFAEWGKKAPATAAYMYQTLEKVGSVIKLEKIRAGQEKDQKQKQGLQMALSQLQIFSQILQKQLGDLINVMEKLPSGSVRAEFEKLIQPWSPKADTPFVRILIRKSGEIFLNDAPVDLAAVQIALAELAKVDGLVLYSREDSGNDEFPALAKQIMQIVISQRLPIRLCERADFSDILDENGKLRLSK